jgi:hypothetical protein
MWIIQEGYRPALARLFLNSLSSIGCFSPKFRPALQIYSPWTKGPRPYINTTSLVLTLLYLSKTHKKKKTYQNAIQETS